MEHTAMMQDILHFDGTLHWCALIAVSSFLIGLMWVFVRVLIPLRRLAKLASSMTDSNLPSFETPSRGIPEIEQLRRSLDEMTKRIQAGQGREAAFRNALADSQEQERTRIAREIHDEAIQSLVLVSHNLERALHSAREDEIDISIHLKNARTQLITTIDNLRQMIADLRSTLLDELGLVSALESLCEEQPGLEFRVAGSEYWLEPVQALALFRTAQEAIRNAVRHAHASRISATLVYSPTSVEFDVRDDGIGFNVPQQFGEFAALGHYGLVGIRERVVHSGGQMKLSSEHNSGTQLSVFFPRLDLRSENASFMRAEQQHFRRQGNPATSK